MEKEIKTVAIIGAGIGGSLLIPFLHNKDVSEILMVVDIDSKAPGFKVAKDLGIPTSLLWESVFDLDVNIIINTTGKDEYNDKIIKDIKDKGKDTALFTGLAAKLVWELIEQKKIIKDLWDLGVKIVAAYDIEEIGELIVEKSRELSETDSGNLVYFNYQDREVSLVYAKGYKRKIAQKFRSQLTKAYKSEISSDAVTDWVFKNRRPLIIEDINENKEFLTEFIKHEGIEAFIAMPFLAGNELSAILYLNDKKPRHFSETLIKNISLLTTMVAFALDKDALLDRLKKSKNQLETSKKQLEAINKISEVTSSSLIIKEILQKGLDKVLVPRFVNNSDYI